MDELGSQPWEGLPTLQLGLTRHILVGGTHQSLQTQPTSPQLSYIDISSFIALEDFQIVSLAFAEHPWPSGTSTGPRPWTSPSPAATPPQYGMGSSNKNMTASTSIFTVDLSRAFYSDYQLEVLEYYSKPLIFIFLSACDTNLVL